MGAATRATAVLAAIQRCAGTAGLRRGLPLATLVFALSSVFWLGDVRGHLHGNRVDMWVTGQQLARAQNLEFPSGLQFDQMSRNEDGSLRYALHNRFPIGGLALIKLAIAPFEGDLSAQLAAARALMLAFFCGAALLAYAALFRLVGSRPIALAATLLAFASYYMLVYNDTVSTEISMDIFAVLLVFHAMVLFRGRADAGRRGSPGAFWWLLATVGVALLVGWHVFALLAPFAVLCLAGEARAAWRRPAPAASRRRFAPRLGVVALAMLRSRSTLLGLLAVLFGASLLGCNLAVEHAHVAASAPEHGAEDMGIGAALARLPTWRSMLTRTGLRRGTDGFVQRVRWDPFLKWQFHRVGVMAVPVAAAGIGGLTVADELDWKHAGAPLLAGLGMAATVVCFGGLLLAGRRGALPGRGMLGVLALSGFCWTIPMHENTVWTKHDFEACMYIGMTLVLFTLLGAGVRHLWRTATGAVVPAGAAVAGATLAALVFVGSNYQMGQDAARRTDAAQLGVLAEFEAIRTLVRGKEVLVAATWSELGDDRGQAFGGVRAAMKSVPATWWYLAGAVLHYAQDLTEAARVEAQGAVDFVLTFERVAAPLHTPAHRFAFLYDAGGVMDAIAAARQRRHDAIAERMPLARGTFDLHLLPLVPHKRSSATRGVRDGDLALAYIKHPCRPEDLRGRFFLEVTPANAKDLPPLLRRAGRDRVLFEPRDDFGLFEEIGLFEEKCLFRVPLPPYPVRSIRTGRFEGDFPGWEMRARLDLHTLRRARDAARGAVPAGRGFFDVHLRGRTLTYVRASCAGADTVDRFLLHVKPARPWSLLRGYLPPAGFANLDFGFDEHGAHLNGDCVATRMLPDYEIARVATGQFDSSGEISWRVVLSPGDRGVPTPPDQAHAADKEGA